jgi:drug/metabolite transporter (DMT)-like permease
MLLAGVLLVGFLLFKNRASLKMSWSQFFSLGLLGLFSIYLTNALEFWGLQQMTAAKTCFFYSLSPFFAALFSYLHFGEKMNARKWVGTAIGFIGFIPVLMAQKGSDELLSSLAFISWPELAVLGAALCSVYGWTLLRLVVKNDAISPWTANGVSMLIGGGLALIHSFLVEPWNPLPVSASNLPVFLQSTLLMTFISNILCYNLYGMLLKRFTSTFLSFMGLLSPVFASFNSWLLLGEPLSPAILMATGVVSIGLWFVYSAELKQGYMTLQKKKPQQGVGVST